MCEESSRSRRLVPLLLLLLLVQPAPSALAQDPLAPLQGRWVVASAEHQGKPFDVITGGVMTIAGAGFEIRTASGTLLRGTLRVDTSARPWQLDLLHADGERWEAIYVLEDREWTLNYVVAGDEPRPSTFATLPASEATIITLRREPR